MGFIKVIFLVLIFSLTFMLPIVSGPRLSADFFWDNHYEKMPGIRLGINPDFLNNRTRWFVSYQTTRFESDYYGLVRDSVLAGIELDVVTYKPLALYLQGQIGSSWYDIEDTALFSKLNNSGIVLGMAAGLRLSLFDHLRLFVEAGLSPLRLNVDDPVDLRFGLGIEL